VSGVIEAARGEAARRSLRNARFEVAAADPGKTLAFAVWHFPENNPFHSALARVVDPVVAPPVLPPDSPEAFLASFRQFTADGELSLPAEVLLVSARK